MPRVTVSPSRRRRHKRILKAARGAYGARSRLLRRAKDTLMRAMRYAQRDRRARKRDFRSLWITRVGAACRQRGVPYNRFINGLAKAKVALNRKMLAEIAVSDPGAFDRLLAIAKGQV